MNQLFRLYTSERPRIKQIVRPLLARSKFLKPFDRNKRAALFIYFLSDVAVSQIDPFFHYEKDISVELNVQFRAISYPDFLRGAHTQLLGADIVLFQTWMDIPEEDCSRLFDLLNSAHPNAKLVYFDWFAPLDLRLARTLNDKIEGYVKKQIHRDFSQYDKTICGRNNLEDHFGKKYSLALPKTRQAVPSNFRQKILLGPGFFTSRFLINKFAKLADFVEERDIDVNARITTDRNDWYGKMRRAALEAVQSIAGRRVVTEFGLTRAAFYRELRRSKICFSPFGYGEICWRDYEAFMAGSLLMKPDVAHLITHPEIFVPFETYVPIDWDFSDLRDKIEYYLEHEEERQRISRNAFQIVHNYVVERKFLKFAASVLGTC